MGVANMSRKSESRNVVANVGREMRSRMGVRKIKKFGAYVIGIPIGVIN